jgi:glutamate carboxypeptidase
MFRRVFYAVLFACFANPTIAAELSATESEMVAAINASLPQAVKELEQVVNINSGTMNLAGVRAVGDRFTPWFEALGFSVEWIDGSEFNRAGHLVATRLSDSPNALRILLIGHLDTVFSVDDEFQRFTPVDERNVAGPGITDMKGGNIIMLQALRGLNAAGQLQRVSIKVVMTGDEESSGEPLSASKHALIEAAKWADIALGFEDGDSNIKTAVIARRGALDWNLSVTARSAHSSQIFQPEVGSGAIFEAARILHEFRQQIEGHGNLTFNPGLFVGGTRLEQSDLSDKKSAFGKTNVIAQSVEISGDLRALTPEELAFAERTMRAIVADNLPHTEATLTLNEGYPPMAPSEGNRRLLSVYNAASEALGYGSVIAVNPRNAGAADISFTAGHVDMALDGLGLMGSGGHTRDEVADMSSLPKNAHKAALLIYRLVENHDR